MKPIIGAQGEFVTLPACDAVVFYPQSYRGGWSVKIDQAKYLYEDGIESDDLAVLDYYATREAAEMALIRAKALQRLKVLAYEGGTDHLKGGVDKYWILLTGAGAFTWAWGEYVQHNLKIDAFFKDKESVFSARETITTDEKAAFLYIYKPTEGE
jgi:hypothetical protein